jgi:ABC-type uncharacterized transport system substrate-binding protein
MIPPAENSITASPISTRLSLVRGKVFKTLIRVTSMLVFVHLADAQQPAKVPRIGFLGATAPSVVEDRTEAFRQGLRDLGYVEGRNIVIKGRYADGNSDRLPALAAELVRLKVDVIVTQGSFSTRVAQKAMRTVPIVMTASADPAVEGMIASLARPGGNITGLTMLSPN